MRSTTRLAALLFLLLATAPRSDASSGFPPALRAITPSSQPQPSSLAIREHAPLEAATMTPDQTLWFGRLLAGMDASRTLIDNGMSSGDSYAIGRGGGDYVEALLMALRATGDRRFLDRVLELTELARAQLRDAWLNGTTDGYTDWNWLADPANAQFYGKDTNWLDESIASGNAALWAYAFDVNRATDPAYAAAADFWRDWLENHFLAKWYQRVGGDPLVAWNTPFAAFYKPDTEPRSANWRLAYYLWKVTGNPFYRDRANEIQNQLSVAQQLNPAHPQAYRWARQLDPSTQEWQAVNYANYYMRVVIEMSLEGLPGFPSAVDMKRFAATFRDVVYAGSLPGLTNMTGEVNGGGSTGYALYAFNGFAAWDSTGFLMDLANRSITGAGNYAGGGLSKAARNDVFISSYALMSLSPPPTTDVLLTAFDAVLESDGTVRVEWQLSSMGADVVTNLYRAVGDGGAPVRVNETPVTGSGPHVVVDTPPAEGGALVYELREVTSDGERAIGRIEVRRDPTGSVDIALAQNEPNPFVSSTVIHFDLPQATRVRLAVYDTGGRLLRVLHDGAMPPGSHSVTWDGCDGRGAPLPGGVYYYAAEAGGRRFVRRAVRLK